jgi:hypothetical protein
MADPNIYVSVKRLMDFALDALCRMGMLRADAGRVEDRL